MKSPFPDWRALLFSGILMFAGAGSSWASDSAEREAYRIAIFDDAGVESGSVETMEEQLVAAGMEVVRLDGGQIAMGALLPDFDVVIFGGGMGNRQSGGLGHAGREEVRRFVREGGGYVGICAGAYLACSGFNWGLGILNARTVSPQWRRGSGLVEVEVMKEGAEITGIPAGYHEMFFANGPIFEPDEREDLPRYHTLAVFRSELAENNAPRGVMTGSPAIAVGAFGEGGVLVSSPHPEKTAAFTDHFLPGAIRWVVGTGDEVGAVKRGGRQNH